MEVLDVNDVVVSKLGRFIATDVDDIDAIIKLGVVDPLRLEKRLKEAIEKWSFDARADRLPQIVANYNTVQRDMLMVEESEIELPGWIDHV